MRAGSSAQKYIWGICFSSIKMALIIRNSELKRVNFCSSTTEQLAQERGLAQHLTHRDQVHPLVHCAHVCRGNLAHLPPCNSHCPFSHQPDADPAVKTQAINSPPTVLGPTRRNHCVDPRGGNPLYLQTTPGVEQGGGVKPRGLYPLHLQHVALQTAVAPHTALGHDTLSVPTPQRRGR